MKLCHFEINVHRNLLQKFSTRLGDSVGSGNSGTKRSSTGTTCQQIQQAVRASNCTEHLQIEHLCDSRHHLYHHHHQQQQQQQLFGSWVCSEHLTEELVSHASLDKLVLGQNAVAIRVHLVKDLFGAFVWRVGFVSRGQRTVHHAVDRLQYNQNTHTTYKIHFHLKLMHKI